MVDSNSENPVPESTLDTLSEKLLGHAKFAERKAVGPRLQAYADERAQRLPRMWKPGAGAYALGARELAVEVGLRYLPLSASTDFIDIADYANRDLYPAYWQNWLNADLLHLFEDEEEALLAAASTMSSQPAARRRAQAVQTIARPSPVQRQVARIAALARRVERVSEGLGVPVEAAVRERTLRLASRPAAELIQVATDEIRQPQLTAELAAMPAASATTPPATAIGTTAAARRPIALQPGVAPTSAERSLPIVHKLLQRARSPYPAGVGAAATFSKMISARPAGAPGRMVSARPISAQPATARQMLAPSIEAPLVRPRTAMRTADVGRIDAIRIREIAPGRALDLGLGARETVQLSDEGRAPIGAPDVWLDDIGIDTQTLSALGTGLTALAAHGDRLAGSVSLVMATDSPRARLLSAVDERTSGRRTGLQLLQTVDGDWRQRFGEHVEARLSGIAPASRDLVQVEAEVSAPPVGTIPAEAAQPTIAQPPQSQLDETIRAATPVTAQAPVVGVTPPAAPGAPRAMAIAPLAAAAIPTVLTPRAARAVQTAHAMARRLDSVKLAGLVSHDVDPSAPRSDTKVALSAHAAQRTERPALAAYAPRLAQLSLAQIAPTTPIDAVTEQRRPVVSRPAERTWQLFSPAKALSLSMALGGSEGLPAAQVSGVAQSAGQQADRLALVLSEGKQALTDWTAAAEKSTVATTAFGRVQVERAAGGVRAMRFAPTDMGSVVQLYAETASPLDRLASTVGAPQAALPPMAVGPVARPPMATVEPIATKPTTSQPKAARPIEGVAERMAQQISDRPVTPMTELPLAPRFSELVSQAGAPAVAKPEWRVTSPAVARVLRTSATTPLVGEAAAETVQRADRPAAVATSAASRRSLPSSIRSPMELLTSVPEAERRAIGRGERIELPAGVTLPAAVMAALRQPPEGSFTSPRLQVLGMLDSPAEVAPRAFRVADAPERVMLLTVGEAPPTPERVEVGRPFVSTAVARTETPVQAAARLRAEAAVSTVARVDRPISPVARAEAQAELPDRRPELQPDRPLAARRPDLVGVEPVQLRAEAARARSEAGLPPVGAPELPPAMLRAIAEATREDLRTPTLAPERVARLVAEGRLDPKTFGWVGGTARWSQAISRPELGAFVPDFSLTGVRGVDVELPRMAMPEAERFLLPSFDIEERVERPSMVAQRAFLPELVTLSDEVAQAAPLATDVARAALKPMTRTQPTVPAVRAAEAFLAAEAKRPTESPRAAWQPMAPPVAYGPAALLEVEPTGLPPLAAEVVGLTTDGQPPTAGPAPRRDRWAAGVLARTEKFAEGAIGRLEGRARPVRGLTAQAGEFVRIEADDTGIETGVGTQAQIVAAVAAQAVQRPTTIQTLAAVQAAERTGRPARPMRLPRALDQGDVVALPSRTEQFVPVSEPIQAPMIGGPRGLPSLRPTERSISAQAREITPTSARSIRTVAERRGAVAPEAPSIQPLTGARVRRSAQLVTRRSMETIQREAVVELRRAGMTATAVQRLTDWVPPTLRPVSAPTGSGTRPSIAAIGPTRSLVDLPQTSAVTTATQAELKPVDSGIRQALRSVIGAAARTAPSGLVVERMAGLSGAPEVPALAALEQRTRAYGQAVQPEVVRQVAPPSAGDAARSSAVRSARAVRSAAQPSRPSAPPAATQQAQQSWRSLLDVVGSLQPSAAEAAQRREGVQTPFANLRWFDRELTTLLQAGVASRHGQERMKPMQPRGMDVVRSMLAYLDAQEPQKPQPIIPGYGPKGGVPGAVVAPEVTKVQPARTRLQPKVVTPRPPRSQDQVQGDQVASARDYVEPWLAAPQPRQPDISLEPLARTASASAGAPGTADGGGGGALSQSEVDGLAADVYERIKDELYTERRRLGG